LTIEISVVFKVEEYVHLLNEKCSKIDQALSTQLGSSTTKTDKQSYKLTLILSVRILTETRRRCWTFLEDKNFVDAARYDRNSCSQLNLTLSKTSF